MNEKNDAVSTPLTMPSEAVRRSWHKPHVSVYEMADAESVSGPNDDADFGFRS
jgi:hypothetical protein